MNFLYNVVFIPDGVDIENINETKLIEIFNEDRFDSKDILRNAANKTAVKKRQIDQYALRNYWKVACCELELLDTPWSGLDDLCTYMKSEYNVKDISKKEKNWRHSSIECTFSSVSERKEEQNKLKSKFGGKLPIVSRKTNLRIALRAKSNIGMEDFYQAKKVFNLCQDWSDISDSSN
jgi:hypothetical protein